MSEIDITDTDQSMNTEEGEKIQQPSRIDENGISTVKATEVWDNSDAENKIMDAKWMYSKDVPGKGDPPEWFDPEKFPTVEDQAKAAAGLRKKLSTGRAPLEYSLNIDETLSDQVSIPDDDPMVSSFKEIAKKNDVTQEAFNDIINMYVRSAVDAEATASQQAEESYKAELARLGPQAEDRLQTISNWATSHLPEEMATMLKDSIVTADQVALWETVIGSATSSIIPSRSKEVEVMTHDRARDMLKDPRFGKSAEFTRKVEDMYRKLSQR